MRMFKRLLLLFSIVIVLISCKEDCYSAPEPVIFEFVNAQGENLIKNGTLTNFAIQEEAQNGVSVGIQLTKTEDFKVKLENVGSFDGTKKYKFFSTIRFFDFSIRSSHVTTECDGFQIDQIDFDSISAAKHNDHYRIILE